MLKNGCLLKLNVILFVTSLFNRKAALIHIILNIEEIKILFEERLITLHIRIPKSGRNITIAILR